MAWLEKDRRTGIYKVGVRLADGKLKKSLRTIDLREAEAIRGTVENTLNAIERGWLTVPEGVDFVEFLICGGKSIAKPTVRQVMTLAQLFETYFASLPTDSLECSTLNGLRIHERQLYRFFKKSFPIQRLTMADLQRFVDHRSKDKGLRGRRVTPVTIRKALITLRTVWNWAAAGGLQTGRFPHSGVKYPKATEKPPFQTWKEIEMQIERGGLDDAEKADLWDSLFLTVPEIVELLDYVKRYARHPFIYPMFVCVAHTGARRSELIRSKLNDVDLAAGVITIQERKRSQAMRTTRRVPLSPLLASVLSGWLNEHPGGQVTSVFLPRCVVVENNAKPQCNSRAMKLMITSSEHWPEASGNGCGAGTSSVTHSAPIPPRSASTNASLTLGSVIRRKIWCNATGT